MSEELAGRLFSEVATTIKQAGETDPSFSPLRLRQAVVQSVQSSSITVRVGGNSTDIAGVVCLQSLPPVGSTVWCFQLGPMLMAIGIQATAATTQSLPAGSMVDFAAATAPAGWLLCDGTAVSRTTFAALFGVISTNYGVGDGSTTFNVPDFRGKVPVGSGTGAGLTARTLAATGGAETHVLTTAQMPSHNHDFQSNNAIVEGGNTFNIGNAVAGQRLLNTGLTGGGAAHNNMQPFLVATKIIKT